MKCIENDQPIHAAKIDSGGSRWDHSRLSGVVSVSGNLVALRYCGCPNVDVARSDKEHQIFLNQVTTLLVSIVLLLDFCAFTLILTFRLSFLSYYKIDRNRGRKFWKRNPWSAEIAGQFLDRHTRNVSRFWQFCQESGLLALDGPFLREREAARKERLSKKFGDGPRRNRFSVFQKLVFRNHANGTGIEQWLAASGNTIGAMGAAEYPCFILSDLVSVAVHGGLHSSMTSVHKTVRMWYPTGVDEVRSMGRRVSIPVLTK